MYPAALLKVFFSYRSFFVESLVCKIILSANKYALSSPFPMFIPFISFSFLFTLAKILSSMLYRDGECGHSSLVPDFREVLLNFFFQCVYCGLAVNVPYYAFLSMQLPSLHSSVCWRGCLSPTVPVWLLCEKSGIHWFVDLGLGLQFTITDQHIYFYRTIMLFLLL